MKLSSTVLLQSIATIIQGANQVTHFLPDDAKFWVTIVVGALQLAQAVVAHKSNPDGTPATVAYVAPTK